jgi:hypothetical protein
MSDIVERLRDRDSVVLSGLFHAIPVMTEAANEIERLREALRLVLKAAENGDEMAAVAAAEAALADENKP